MTTFLSHEIISKLIKTEGNEFEVRFGHFTDKFVPLISLQAFEECIKFTNTFAVLEDIEYSNIVYYENGKEYTILEPPIKGRTFSDPETSKTKSVTIVSKKCNNSYDFDEYNIRISSNTETSDFTPTKKLFEVQRKRFKYRYSNYLIDISMYNDVNGVLFDKTKMVKFNIEIEVTDRKSLHLDSFTQLIYNYLLAINKTRNLITRSDTKKVLRYYNSLVKTDKFVGSQPHTISKEKINKNTCYSLTLKLDGKRTFLMSFHANIFEISQKKEVTMTSLFTTEQGPFLLDTEYFQGKWYAFDILISNGYDVRKLPFTERINILNKLVTAIGNPLIVKKTFIYSENLYEDTMKIHKQYFSKRNDLIDGIIFTSTDSAYQEPSLKWKPIYNNSIDLKIKKIKDSCKWNVYCSGDQLFVYPGFEGVLTVSEADNEIYTDGTVIEFLIENGSFKILKPRLDKAEGNFIDVALDNLSSILEPFDFSSLLDTNTLAKNKIALYNSRRFNNFIKRILLKKYSKTAYTLLDLACGKGGDMNKWIDSNITFVKGYDNDKNSLKQAVIRYKSVKTDDTTKNFNFSFDYADLSEEFLKPDLHQFIQDNNGPEKLYKTNGFDVVTCFFAIHYFFQSQQKMNTFFYNIVSNLKLNGYFILTTFDNKQLYNHNYTVDTPDLKITPKSFNETPFNNSIEVYIKDSVLDQAREEYIVDFDFLVYTLKQYGLTLVESNLFEYFYKDWKTRNNTLDSQEKTLSFMNRYAVFIKDTEITFEDPEPTQQEPEQPEFQEEPTYEHTQQEPTQEPIQEQDPKIEFDNQVKILSKKKVKELKEICNILQIETTGKKNDIVCRIAAKKTTPK